MYTHDYVYNAIMQNVQDEAMRNFYLNSLNLTTNSTYLSPEQKQYKYMVILRNIGVYVETQHANSPLTIIWGTITGTVEDILSGMGEFGNRLLSVANFLTNPFIMILLIGAAVYWFVLRKTK